MKGTSAMNLARWFSWRHRSVRMGVRPLRRCDPNQMPSEADLPARRVTRRHRRDGDADTEGAPATRLPGGECGGSC